MKIHSLQAVRAIAAWLVVLDHVFLEISGNAGQDPLTHVAWKFGEAGVCAFFVISGFIMVHISWNSFGKHGASLQFLRRRLVRIVPLYWFGTFAALAYHKISVTHGADDGWPELLQSLAFIPYAGASGSWTPVLPQGWTLNYEMMFYLIFAVGLNLNRTVGLAMIGVSLCTLIVLGPLVANPTLAFLASPISLFFLAGMIAGVVWRLRSYKEAARIARFASLFEPFGDSSYSLYIVHGLVLTMALRIWTMLLGSPSFAIVPVSLVFATLVGWLTHHLLEKPLLDLTNRLFDAAGGRLRQPSGAIERRRE